MVPVRLVDQAYPHGDHLTTEAETRGAFHFRDPVARVPEILTATPLRSCWAMAVHQVQCGKAVSPGAPAQQGFVIANG